MARKVFTKDDYLSIEDIRELNTEMQALAGLREEIFGANLGAVRNLDISLGVTTMAGMDFINQIERNIDALAGTAPPAGMEPTRTWQGENRDAPLLSFRDVNRWFGSMAIIRQSLMGRSHGFRATGSHVAGPCNIRQKIRSVGG
ncbi:MAG: hypothetical protein FWC76_02790 [Defluviitaleaceae bacterium]|nr:hypothetical protein [Defluviitaleaceae bacterium]